MDSFSVQPRTIEVLKRQARGGDLPHGKPHNSHGTPFGLSFWLMKTTPTKSVLTFGGLVENFYNTYGERNAKGLWQLAFKTKLIVFRGRSHCVVSQSTGKT